MCKFPGKILMLATIALFLSVGAATADPSSQDWNDSWGFPTPFEKANTLNQALAIELIEDGGFTNENSFYTTNTSVLAIGNQVIIDGSDNDVSNLDNDGNVGAQINNGDGGTIDQGGQNGGPSTQNNN